MAYIVMAKIIVHAHFNTHFRTQDIAHLLLRMPPHVSTRPTLYSYGLYSYGLYSYGQQYILTRVNATWELCGLQPHACTPTAL